MLNDEEKEALRNFKSEYETCDHYSSDLIIELDDAEIILNLIEKQSKEIEELKAKNEKRLNILFDYEDRLEHYEDKVFNELDNYINMDELQKLDRIGLKGKKYISEDKIKSKIEKYKKLINECPMNDEEIFCKECTEKCGFNQTIDVLQSLLEKE